MNVTHLFIWTHDGWDEIHLYWSSIYMNISILIEMEKKFDEAIFQEKKYPQVLHCWAW